MGKEKELLSKEELALMRGGFGIEDVTVYAIGVQGVSNCCNTTNNGGTTSPSKPTTSTTTTTNIYNVIISGGEPMMYPHFEQLLRKVTDLRMSFFYSY